jgi:hypothetical protein
MQRNWEKKATYYVSVDTVISWSEHKLFNNVILTVKMVQRKIRWKYDHKLSRLAFGRRGLWPIWRHYPGTRLERKITKYVTIRDRDISSPTAFPLNQPPRSTEILNQLPRSTVVLNKLPRSTVILNKLPRPTVTLKQLILSTVVLNKFPCSAVILNKLPRSTVILNELPQSTVVLNKLPWSAVISDISFVRCLELSPTLLTVAPVSSSFWVKFG